MQNDSINTIIGVESVTMRFDNRTVLSDINLIVNRGDFIAITGPNGGGKTTLLRIMLKLLKPTIGTINYYSDGKITSRLPIGYLPQKNLIDSRFPISVRDVVESGLLGNKDTFARIDAADSAQATAMIDKLGLSALTNEPLGNLSGGQMQRALLGRALISNPEVVVLDEPLSYVDKRFEKQIYDTIGEIAPNCTILLVSHEMTAIAPMANRHIIIDGTLHECHAAHHFVISDCE